MEINQHRLAKSFSINSLVGLIMVYLVIQDPYWKLCNSSKQLKKHLNIQDLQLSIAG